MGRRAIFHAPAGSGMATNGRSAVVCLVRTEYQSATSAHAAAKRHHQDSFLESKAPVKFSASVHRAVGIGTESVVGDPGVWSLRVEFGREDTQIHVRCSEPP